MRSHVLSFLLLLIIFSCKSSKKTPQVVVEEKPRANWMLARPTSQQYYTGIGLANKAATGNDFINAAKKKALEDLASEIKININTNSILHQIEKSSGYSENYSSIVTSSTNLNLEGYQVVDTWENEHEYWIYYQLSKTEYQRIQNEKKQNATERALNQYNLAQGYYKENKLDLTIKHYLDGLFILKEYLGEQIMVTINQETIDLNTRFYQNLQKSLSEINLVTNDNVFTKKISNKAPITIPVSVESSQGSLSNVFIEASYLIDDNFGKTRKETNSLLSSVDGICRFSLNNLSKNPYTQKVKFSLSLSKIPVIEHDEKLKQAIYSGLIVPEKVISVEIQMPSIYIQSNEKNLDSPLNTPGLSSFLINELTKEGIEISPTAKRADRIIEVITNTSKAGESSGIYSANLNTQVLVKDGNGQTVFQKSLSGIRGSQLSFEKAGMEAYKNAEKEVRFKLLKDLLKELL